MLVLMIPLFRTNTTMRKATMNENEKIWQLTSKASYGLVHDAPVLLHEDHEDAIMLNESAACFIELCDGERSVDEIISMIVEDFEVSEEQLALDLKPFIEAMNREGIIELA
jgi:hypothetical protein